MSQQQNEDIFAEVPNAERLTLFRRLLFAEAVLYTLWWFVIHLTYPPGYNPWTTRIIVVGYCLLCIGLSFRSSWVRKNIEAVFYSSFYVLIIENFHIKYVSFIPVQWPISTFITVMAVSSCFFSSRALLIYSFFVAACSVFIDFHWNHFHSFYLPGMFTIIVASNLSLYYRNRVIKSLDIERRKSYEARAAVRIRDQFISIASHELKTPLTPLKMNNEVLLRVIKERRLEEFGMERAERMMQITANQVDRLAHLVEEMLDVSRINSGQLPLQPETFYLKELVEHITLCFSPEFSRSRSSLSLRIPQSLKVSWDRLRIEQVLTNLIKNAIIYGEGKKICLMAKEKGSEIIIAVRDHGIGIDIKDQKRIFNRFERAVSSRNYGGLGLGLYITHCIVRAHGGKIGVKSALGRGSTFYALIPQGVSGSSLTFG